MHTSNIPAEPEPQWRGVNSGWAVDIVAPDAPDRIFREQQLTAAGVPLPFASRAAVTPSFLATVRHCSGEWAGGIGLSARVAPGVPGHVLLRAEQLGSSVPTAAADALIGEIVGWVKARRNVLRLSIDVFGRDHGRRSELVSCLKRHGFRRPRHINGYVETLVIDLVPDEDEIFRSLHHSARRKVRQISRYPLAVRSVDDPALASRMNALLWETMERTGGPFAEKDWGARIELSREHPDLSRIVGLFRTDASGPASLLAFAWGCHSGDHAYYSDAASTRDTGELRAPLAYALMWDLIVWAKRTGATYFDMGGITRGTHADEDPLGGISDFKRYFSQTVVRVRDEWILDRHSLRAAAVSVLHGLMRG